MPIQDFIAIGICAYRVRPQYRFKGITQAVVVIVRVGIVSDSITIRVGVFAGAEAASSLAARRIAARPRPDR